MRAILSVSDKANLVDFAKQLQELKIDIYSTAGPRSLWNLLVSRYIAYQS